MGLALQEFVDKDEKQAICEIVKLQLRDTQKTLSTRNVRDEDIVKEIIKETERSRAEEPSQEEQERTRQVALTYFLDSGLIYPLYHKTGKPTGKDYSAPS